MNTDIKKPEPKGANAIIRYSLQLAMLSRLLCNKLITRSEYEKVRIKLMEKFNVISEMLIQPIPRCDVQYTMFDTHSKESDYENS
jgi:hypothetical protein